MSDHSAARAVEQHLTSRGVRPVRIDEGRFAVYVPGGGRIPDLEVMLTATAATRGILARVRTLLRVPQESAPKALHLVNRWNRTCVMPHAVVATRERHLGTEAPVVESMILLEAYLPPGATWQPDQVGGFVDQVTSGARRFWASPTVRSLCVPAGKRQGEQAHTSPFDELTEELDV